MSSSSKSEQFQGKSLWNFKNDTLIKDQTAVLALAVFLSNLEKDRPGMTSFILRTICLAANDWVFRVNTTNDQEAVKCQIEFDRFLSQLRNTSPEISEDSKSFADSFIQDKHEVARI